MKKTLCTVVSCLLLAATLLGTLTSCDINFNLGDLLGGGGDTVVTEYVQPTTIQEFYAAYPKESATLLRDPTTDGVYNYFYLHLGEIKNATLHAESAKHYNGYVEEVYEWTTTTAYETGVTKAQAQCIKEAVNTELKSSVSSELTAGGGVSYSGLSANVQATAKAGLESTLGYSNETSVEKSTAETVKTMVENTHKKTVKIKENSPQGWYRYAVYATVDVYVTVVCNIKEKTYCCEYSIVPQEGTYWDGFVYFENNDFGSTSDERISLNPSDLDGMNVYSDSIPNYQAPTAVVLHSTTQKTITDIGGWGLEQPSKDDVFYLSDFSSYFTNEYVFVFDVVVNLKEKDDGYQEVFLYNKQEYIKDSADRFTRAQVENLYGLVAGDSGIESGSGAYDHELRWEVDGSKCADKMYVRYDAHGKYDDHWYRNSILITVTVQKKGA